MARPANDTTGIADDGRLGVPHDGHRVSRSNTASTRASLSGHSFTWIRHGTRALFASFSHARHSDEHRPDANKQQPAVVLSRTIMPMLAAVGTFGAAVSFGTLFQARSTTSNVTVLALMAWAWTSFIFGVALCIIWQVALAADFRDGAPGRAFRHTLVIFGVLMMCCLSVFAGTLLLSLSLVYDAAPAIRNAGFTAVFLISTVTLIAGLRLTGTVWRRINGAGYRGVPQDLEVGRTMIEIPLSVFPADDLESTREKNQRAIEDGMAENVVLETVLPVPTVETGEPIAFNLIDVSPTDATLSRSFTDLPRTSLPVT